jgi:hypothetical protein
MHRKAIGGPLFGSVPTVYTRVKAARPLHSQFSGVRQFGVGGNWQPASSIGNRLNLRGLTTARLMPAILPHMSNPPMG